MTQTTTSRDSGSVSYLTFLSVVAALGGLLFGFDTAVISGALGPLRALFFMGPIMEGWLVSSALVGSAVGAAVAGPLSDRFGRRFVLVLSGALFLLCSVGCVLAWNLDVLIFARWIGGVGVGLASLVSPLYIAEIATAGLRGRMVTLFQFAITVGICLALFSNAWLQHLSTSLVAGSSFWHSVFASNQIWRGMFGMEFFPAAIFTILCCIIPEAPRWLIQSGRPQQALAILERVGGRARALSELDEIRAAVSSETGSLRDLLRPGLRKALFVSLFLAIASELSGVTVVFYYGPSILMKAGFSIGGALGGFASIGLVNMLFTVLAIWLMDIAGRRLLLFAGTVGASAALASIGFLFHNPAAHQIALVAMMCLFIACFAFSMGPIKWVVISEIFPTRIRGRAMAIGTVAVWVTDGLYNQYFPLLRDSLGIAGTFFLFAIMLLPQIIFIWKVMPETRGRSLEEIEHLWATPI